MHPPRACRTQQAQTSTVDKSLLPLPASHTHPNLPMCSRQCTVPANAAATVLTCVTTHAHPLDNAYRLWVSGRDCLEQHPLVPVTTQSCVLLQLHAEHSRRVCLFCWLGYAPPPESDTAVVTGSSPASGNHVSHCNGSAAKRLPSSQCTQQKGPDHWRRGIQALAALARCSRRQYS